MYPLLGCLASMPTTTNGQRCGECGVLIARIKNEVDVNEPFRDG